jgi:ATP-dependent Clp protease ATP-binding subunit ClpC
MERLLDLLPAEPPESPQTVATVYDTAMRIAVNVGSPQTTSVHLLMAVSRLATSRAAQLLEHAGLSTFDLRTRAMAHLTDWRLRRSASERLAATPTPTPPRRADTTQPAPRPHRVATATVPATSRERPLEPDDDMPVIFEALGESPQAAPQPVRPAPEPQAVASILPQTPATDAPAPPATPPMGFDLDPIRFPTLNALGRNLTADAARGRIDPLVGRDRELDAVVDILCKRRANNPLLLGDPGVGKTALVEGLAARIALTPEAVPGLSGRIVLSVSVADLVAGTAMRGSFSARMKDLKDEVLAADGRVVLFLDEIHTLIGAGQGDGGMDAANDLKGALARGELPCIGATTFSEYKRHILTDPALKRRFEPVTLREPDLDEAERILAGVAPRYAEHHRVAYTEDALRTAVRLTDRVIPDRSLPAKAIDVLDRAGARVRREGRAEVRRDDVVEVLAALVDLPREFLALSPSERLGEMADFLKAHVFGQPEGIDAIVRTLARNWSRFGSRRPLGSFLFAGPTGAGKRTLALAMAQFLFGTRQAVLEIDLADYGEAHTLANLIGSPPGYVGHDEGGLLADTLIRRPFLVVLWHHADQAHPSVLSLVAQILSEGSSTDRLGRRIDFRNSVQILTLSSDDALGSSARTLGFGAAAPTSPAAGPIAPHDPAFARLKKRLSPDLAGAVDQAIAFTRLDGTALDAIVHAVIDRAARGFRDEYGLSLHVEAPVVQAALDAVASRDAAGEAAEAWVAERILRPAADRAISAPPGTDGLVVRIERDAVSITPTEPAA